MSRQGVDYANVPSDAGYGSLVQALNTTDSTITAGDLEGGWTRFWNSSIEDNSAARAKNNMLKNDIKNIATQFGLDYKEYASYIAKMDNILARSSTFKSKTDIANSWTTQYNLLKAKMQADYYEKLNK